MTLKVVRSERDDGRRIGGGLYTEVVEDGALGGGDPVEAADDELNLIMRAAGRPAEEE